jgi:hypothetical protein
MEKVRIRDPRSGFGLFVSKILKYILCQLGVAEPDLGSGIWCLLTRDPVLFDPGSGIRDDKKIQIRDPK